jgi:dienelactone hydrolase
MVRLLDHVSGRLPAAILMLLALLSPASAHDTSIAGYPARVELHPIASLTLSDAQFLRGDPNGTPVTVAGQLRIAQGIGRMPVVVLMHGSGGIGANIEPWVEQFNAMGISTFTLDGFTGRGIVSTSTDQKQLGRLNFILDIYRALEILAQHPRVDPQRIALIGFSRGGQAALFASLKRFHRLWNRSGIDFAAYLPFYPDCATQYAEETDLVDKPVRLFHGRADDYNPLASCRAFQTRLARAGRTIEITEYAAGNHGFDAPFPLGTIVAAGAQTVRGCAIQETAPGVLTNTATGAPFSYDDACVVRDPHVGGNAQAAAAAHRDVGDFIRTLFKLN